MDQPDPIVWDLGEEGVERAKDAARNRIKENRAFKTEGKYGAPGGVKSMYHDLEGAKGELAVALAFGLRWVPHGKWRIIDVGGKLEVKATSHPRGRLILHEDAHDAVPYILARVGRGPDDAMVKLMGWVYGRDAKLKAYWWSGRKDGEAFFVPMDKLNDMRDIPLYLAGAMEGGRA